MSDASLNSAGNQVVSSAELRRLHEENAALRKALADGSAEALSGAAKVFTLGEVARSVAHDFKNLIMVIQGNAELLRRKVPAAAAGENAHHFDGIVKAARECRDLANEVLNWT